jgi:hypothetical protein
MRHCRMQDEEREAHLVGREAADARHKALRATSASPAAGRGSGCGVLKITRPVGAYFHVPFQESFLKFSDCLLNLQTQVRVLRFRHCFERGGTGPRHGCELFFDALRYLSNELHSRCI